MPAQHQYTLTHPGNGQLLLKVYAFQDNGPFDHIQRLSYYTVVFLTQGNLELTADFATYPVLGSSLLFFAPYQPFMLRPAEDITGIVLHFHSDFFCIHHHQKEVACNGVLFNNIYQTPVLPVSPSDMEQLLTLIQQIKSEIARPNLAQNELLISLLKIFLIRTSRLKQEQLPAVVTDPREQRKTEIAQILKDAIELHFRSRHSPADYAALLHISPKVLARTARAYYHKTLTTLIAERIIIDAKRELYMTAKTVKEIAYLLGFEDEYYFSRFFKNHAGVSPQLFRETVGFARAEPFPVSILGHMDVPGAN